MFPCCAACSQSMLQHVCAEQFLPCTTAHSLTSSLHASAHHLCVTAKCQLQLVLFTEERAADSADAFYPINALRNRGLQLAGTEVRWPKAARPCRDFPPLVLVGPTAWLRLAAEERSSMHVPCSGCISRGMTCIRAWWPALQAVLLLDVDFIVSAELGSELAAEESWEALARRIRAGSAVVLPAFETPFDATGAWRLEHPPETGRALAFEVQAGAPPGCCLGHSLLANACRCAGSPLFAFSLLPRHCCSCRCATAGRRQAGGGGELPQRDPVCVQGRRGRQVLRAHAAQALGAVR